MISFAAGARTDPPEEVLDAWFVETFHRPPEERDDLDMPRMYRAMEAQRILSMARRIERVDTDSLMGLGGDDLKLFEDVMKAWPSANG